MKRHDIPENLQFDERGLIPAVVQNAATGRVLMVAFMSRESLEKTFQTGEAHFWSRQRNELWRKGATSGNVMKVLEVVADCDADCLLLRVSPAGPACHTGETSCFFTSLGSDAEGRGETSLSEMIGELTELIHQRNEKRPPGSYTTELFAGGVDRIAKKVGEEAVEVVIAGKNGDAAELCRESADLLYHLLVLWEETGVSPSAVGEELKRRRH
ncbi:MAG TPA: bifunctional phosphoribosyl-AMP cyclohydrolase/phosphoribosyl-ATP diphosphatase HisIE [Vicinamibacteria bacterium]|nr:bifunctional phosphoribosyl-AMP cyclohydrolase/phosphoribosyl-ATP diphosphatase HisIE [Vicinamibacteria bacterium]